jgi:hypothetical protein
MKKGKEKSRTRNTSLTPLRQMCCNKSPPLEQLIIDIVCKKKIGKFVPLGLALLLLLLSISLALRITLKEEKVCRAAVSVYFAHAEACWKCLWCFGAAQLPYRRLFFRPGWTLRGERVCWVWLVSPKGHLVGDRPFSFLAGNQYRLDLVSSFLLSRLLLRKI